MRWPDSIRDRGFLLRCLVAIALLLFLFWHVRRLQDPALGGGDLAPYALLALVPVTVLAWLGRRAAVLASCAAAIIAVGLATGHWPSRADPVGGEGWIASASGDLADGVRSWLRDSLPFDSRRGAEVRSVVQVGTFVLLAGFFWAWLRAPRPLLAGMLAFAPFAVVSTVFVLPAREARAGAFLALVLAMFALVERGGRRVAPQAAVATAVTVALAIGLASVPGVARGALLPWTDWAINDSGERVRVGFVWSQDYKGIDLPTKGSVVLRVASPIRAYWRATTLDTFDGARWVEAFTAQDRAGPGETLRVSDDERPEVGPPSEEAGLRVDPDLSIAVTVEALAEPYLLSAGQPVSYEVPPSARSAVVTSSGVAWAAYAPARGAEYEVHLRRIDPSPELLQRSGTDYPLVVAGAHLQAFPGQPVPAFGEPGREEIVRELLASNEAVAPERAGWLEAYDLAVELIRGVDGPYGATLAIERYFRSRYLYDERASLSGPSPLPGFITDPQSGYCQMFSGSMAQLLRLLGIPARIAEGFTPGKYDSRKREYVVTDREAHAWVEVYFPEYGWIPFDPTPTRALPTRASVSSPFGSAFFGENGPLGLRAQGRRTPDGRPLGAGAVPFDAGGGAAGAREGAPWRPGPVTFALLAVLLLALALVAAKRVRVGLGARHSDSRRRADAARAQLVWFAADQGVELPASLTNRELAARLARDFGVDASHWAHTADRARFGPPRVAAAAVADLARETRQLLRALRDVLERGDRVRGALSLRSLLLGLRG